MELIAAGGDRYSCTYYDDKWSAEHGIDWRPGSAQVTELFGL